MDTNPHPSSAARAASAMTRSALMSWVKLYQVEYTGCVRPKGEHFTGAPRREPGTQPSDRLGEPGLGPIGDDDEVRLERVRRSDLDTEGLTLFRHAGVNRQLGDRLAGRPAEQDLPGRVVQHADRRRLDQAGYGRPGPVRREGPHAARPGLPVGDGICQIDLHPQTGETVGRRGGQLDGGPVHRPRGQLRARVSSKLGETRDWLGSVVDHGRSALHRRGAAERHAGSDLLIVVVQLAC